MHQEKKKTQNLPVTINRGKDIDGGAGLLHSIDLTFDAIGQALNSYDFGLLIEYMGFLDSVGTGTVTMKGLSGIKVDELIELPDNTLGVAFNVGEEETGLVLLDKGDHLSAGDEARSTDRVLEVPVGKEFMGRVVDGLGRPLDGRGRIKEDSYLPVERPAHSIMDRLPVSVPLQTGIKVIDALIPVGRGQRELIIGDRQTGKTAIALDTIINQRNGDMICIYCGVGKRSSAVAKVVEKLRENNALEYTIIIAATEADPPGLQYITPYAATSMGEYFMEQGKDVLIVYDDLTRHARAYRELSLLLRRPPGREAYPGDIFYIHSRLLERSTHLREDLGGGSLSALPVIETEAQNISAYIPTNLISITDGQIYLSPGLFQKGVLPAVDVGRSVSRVGGKTQLPAYRAVAGDLRLSYSQFEELEAFARFGTQMDEETRHTLERGRRVREILKQQEYHTLDPAEQIASLVAVNEGVFDNLDIEDIREAEEKAGKTVREELPDICARIEKGEKIGREEINLIAETVKKIFE